ncbi:MAG: glutathione S-transferase family protein [Hyphomicrobiaceae bacterium]
MKLYDLKAGMNPRRVRIFLAEKGVTVPIVNVDMMKGENHTPMFLALNPLGTMPVLELDDGTILTESMAICRYFEALHPEPNLFGQSALEQAQVEMWNRRAEMELMRPLSDQFRHLSPFWKDRLEQVPDFGAMAQRKAREAMAWFDRELATRPYLAGTRYTVADITAQCALLLGKGTGMPIPDELQNLGRWWALASARPTARA